MVAVELLHSCKKRKTYHGGCSNLFDVLPRECMVTVLKFLNSDLKHLVRLASCDRYLQTLLFNEMPFLWERIDFSGYRPLMTDAQLHSFLIRVHAVDVTQELLLRSQYVTGTGLLPLMNSEVLSRIDLRVDRNVAAYMRNDRGTGLDEPIVAAVLTSMLPHKLEKVIFHGSTSPREMSYTWGAFVSRLNLKLMDLLREENTLCGYCHLSISKHTEWFGALARRLVGDQLRAKCGKCGIVSCRQVLGDVGGCPELHTCPDCGDAFCPACATECSGCIRCKQCNEGVYICGGCEVLFCTHFSCLGVRCAGGCKRLFCEECSGEDCRFCGECERSFCLSCKPTQPEDECDDCGAWLCPSDAAIHPPMSHCDYCGHNNCLDCHEDHQCVPPWRKPFDSAEEWTLCNCGRNRIRGTGVVAGQTFVCCYAAEDALDSRSI